ncbi:MAG: hypothetical protein JXA00_02955 [Candidatus Thermoplasmatota archaeon]|nr:hypothetical protein [Candidatus Thermoplasmatota archaeon]
MKKTSSTIVILTVVLLAIPSVLIAAHAGYVTHTLPTQKTAPIMNTATEFYANITVYLFEGEGCGCVPLRFIPINATGRDTDHSTSGVTDDDGKCVLQLEYDRTYRVRVQDPNYESLLFDFVVLDDQLFAFHLKQTEESSQGVTLLQVLLQRLQLMKHFLS